MCAAHPTALLVAGNGAADGGHRAGGAGAGAGRAPGPFCLGTILALKVCGHHHAYPLLNISNYIPFVNHADRFPSCIFYKNSFL